MEHTLKSYVCAALSLVGVPGLLPVAQKSDFAWLLRKQHGLSSIPADELLKKELECHATTTFRRGALRTKTLVSLAWVASAIAVACVGLFHCFSFAAITTTQVFSIASVTAFAWGTLGRLGWTEQSNKGTTIYERLDTFLFWLFYWAGTFCGVAALANGTT